MLHTIAAAASQPAVQTAWVSIPAALDGALPCPLCEQHYHTWLKTHPVGDAATWLLALHNAVNARNGSAQWSADQLTAAYPVTAESVAAAREALASLQGVIGVAGHAALSAALAAIAV